MILRQLALIAGVKQRQRLGHGRGLLATGSAQLCCIPGAG